MSKQSGLGDRLFVGGYDLSGDIGSVQRIAGGPAPLDMTGINKSAFERQGGLRDGGIDYTAYFNPTGAHPVIGALPTSDVVLTYCRGASLGGQAANLVAKQLNYDGTRNADGSLSFTVQSVANGYGLEWGTQLTAGLRTDGSATNGTGVDGSASSTFGLQAYLHVFAFTGTDATVKLQDSADNSSWADVTGGAFTQITTGPGTQRIATANNLTVRRYLRAVTITTGGFTDLQFAVSVTRNATEPEF